MKEAKQKLNELMKSPAFIAGIRKERDDLHRQIENRQKYIWLPFTDFEVRIAKSIPEWKRGPKPKGDQSWKSGYILKRSITRKARLEKPIE